MAVERVEEEDRNEAAERSRNAPRSPVLDSFRLSPFRVLRLPIDARAEEAVWKAEDILGLMGAGLHSGDDDLLPWLPEPDEHEVRQAVQSIEEPLRRMVEEAFWFDFGGDPEGDALRQALAGLDAGAVSAYLDREAAEAPVSSRLNRANLRLLLAALATTDALPEGFGGSVSSDVGSLPWSGPRDMRVVEDNSALDFGRARRIARLESCRGYWCEALAQWGKLLSEVDFSDHLRASVARLGDELVTEDDIEVLVSGVTTRLIDVVAGEAKRQVLEGRFDRVRTILDAASASGIEPKQWGMAIRPLRHLFKAEIAELDVLLENPESLDSEDVAAYLDRLGSLAKRWADLDAHGLLGLPDITDEAVRSVDALIGQREDFGAIARVQDLLKKAEAIATAASLKQKVQAHAANTASRTRWACHFCDTREMDPECSTVLKGQKEVGRTRHFNSTTIHYAVRYELVQRCERCADLHHYFHAMGNAFRFALVLPLLATWYGLSEMFMKPDQKVGFAILSAVAAAAILAAAGPIARFILARGATPEGERLYWDLKSSKQHKALRDEFYGITKDYRKNALAIARTTMPAS